MICSVNLGWSLTVGDIIRGIGEPYPVSGPGIHFRQRDLQCDRLYELTRVPKSFSSKTLSFRSIKHQLTIGGGNKTKVGVPQKEDSRRGDWQYKNLLKLIEKRDWKCLWRVSSWKSLLEVNQSLGLVRKALDGGMPARKLVKLLEWVKLPYEMSLNNAILDYLVGKGEWAAIVKLFELGRLRDNFEKPVMLVAIESKASFECVKALSQYSAEKGAKLYAQLYESAWSYVGLRHLINIGSIFAGAVISCLYSGNGYGLFTKNVSVMWLGFWLLIYGAMLFQSRKFSIVDTVMMCAFNIPSYLLGLYFLLQILFYLGRLFGRN